MKHKHYDCIVAWAEGKTVQNFNDRRMCWEDITGDPYWVNSFQYRIKPEPKPDVVKHFFVEAHFLAGVRLSEASQLDVPVLSITFDGETGKLKEAVVL